MEELLPGVFNAAGLMVPSTIPPPPMPFIDDVAGAAAEYMVASLSNPQPWPRPSRRTNGAGARWRPQQDPSGMATATATRAAGAVLIRTSGAMCRMQASRARKA